MEGRRPTIREVARRSGFSVSTVSRALNGYTDVAATTRSRILQVATDLEYRPAAAARSLVTRRSQIIGVFLDTGKDHPDLQHPFFQEVLVGLKNTVGRAGYDLLLFASDPPADNVFGPQSYLDRCRQHGVDGAVLIGATDEGEVRRLVRSEVACLGIDLDIGEGSVFVSSDNVGGAKLAVDHLVELGHQRIAAITGLMHTRPGVDRLRGYREGLQQHGLAFRDEYVAYGDFYVDSGTNAMRQLLALDEPPTAVFAAADLTALGAVKAASELGVKVPEDVSVVGFDDIALACHLHPPLTTVRQNKVQMGVGGGEALLAAIDGIRNAEVDPVDSANPNANGHRREVTVPVELVARGSTAVCTASPEI